jgi:hypothetical protein
MNDERSFTQVSGRDDSPKKKGRGRKIGLFVFLGVLLLIGWIGYNALSFQSKIDRIIHTDVARNYPALGQEGQPQVIEFAAVEGGSIDYVDLIDRQAVVAVIELQAGIFSGYRFRQRIEFPRDPENPENVGMIVPAADKVLLQRFVNGELQRRVYISGVDLVYDLPAYALEIAGEELTDEQLKATSTVDGSEVFIEADCGCDELDELFRKLIPDLLRELFPESDPAPKAQPKPDLKIDPKTSV